MAGIDKTYTDSYEEYREFKDWADKQFVQFFDGYKECVGDYVRDLNKEDFTREIPVMNTPTWLDIYLIQNCKSEFVLKRMKEVYSEDEYKKFQAIDLSAPPPKDFQQNRKISIVRCKRTKYPLHSSPYDGREWWLQCDDNFWYNDDTKTWTSRSCYYYPSNTDTAHIGSIKAVVRHLRKQYLPKGITFRLSGKYVGEDYKILIK